MGVLQEGILEWVAMLFPRGSSQTRDRTQVFCIAGTFFTVGATREVIYMCVCACVKFLQSCLTLCDPMDSSPLGSSVYGNS